MCIPTVGASTHQAFNKNRITQLRRLSRSLNQVSLTLGNQLIERALIVRLPFLAASTITLQKLGAKKQNNCAHGESNSALPLICKMEGGNHKPLDHTRLDDMCLVFYNIALG